MMTKEINRLLMFIAFISVAAFSILAESVTRGNVSISYEKLADGGIRVTEVRNDNNTKVFLIVDGRQVAEVPSNSGTQISQKANTLVRFGSPSSSGAILWKAAPKKETAVDPAPAVTPAPSEDTHPAEDTPTQQNPAKKDEPRSAAIPEPEADSRPANSGGAVYADIIYHDAFFGTEAVNAFTQKVDAYCKGLDSSKDKSQYIIDNDIRQFLDDSGRELADKRSKLAGTTEKIIRKSNIDVSVESSTANLIKETLDSRLKTREQAYTKLKTKVEEADGGAGIIPNNWGDDLVNYCIVGAIVLLLIVLIIVAIRKKKSKKGNSATDASLPAASQVQSVDHPTIVVRRRTTSILKKQNIDDVIDNPAYLLIHTSDFTPDSAVRNIYIKNTCIKEIYNLYAEDLRNTEKPNEDGCMVLGRWVYNESAHAYDISLEEVVFPGDDAVFKEYELNFGGKIKLRIAERLRKLRKDSNLQYDLVCWIHSHPGLGVFFSNSDDNVQMQLKHPQHPNFLIAFVVDILTSSQEMGIFTFRKDGSMNSKGDITKMYSLEEMYKWALQSERNTYTPGNYFNILENANWKLPTCHAVELNNSSIIDLSQIAVEPETGIVGWAVGTSVEDSTGRKFAVSRIIRNAEKPASFVIGCLISMPRMSYPDIRRLIARDSANLSFVMVYSPTQMTLTTIPVANGELLSDEKFYGDVNIDDLKIWTRRKR